MRATKMKDDGARRLLQFAVKVYCSLLFESLNKTNMRFQFTNSAKPFGKPMNFGQSYQTKNI